jgi:hypothetical protein
MVDNNGLKAQLIYNCYAAYNSAERVNANDRVDDRVVGVGSGHGSGVNPKRQKGGSSGEKDESSLGISICFIGRGHSL